MRIIDLTEGEVIVLSITPRDDRGNEQQAYVIVDKEWVVDLSQKARELGREAGIAAGSWVFNGNNDIEDYERIGKGIEDGDPEILDGLPQPDLSGQDADGPTPRSIMNELGINDGPMGNYPDMEYDLESHLCDLWCEGFREGVEFEVSNTIRFHLVEE